MKNVTLFKIIFYKAINILLFLELGYIFFLVILFTERKNELSIDVKVVRKSHRMTSKIYIP